MNLPRRSNIEDLGHGPRLLLLLALLWGLLPGAAAAEPRGLVGTEGEHLTVAGENLYLIAKQHGLAIEHLAFANGLKVGLEVKTGRQLRVPRRRILPSNPPENGLVVNLPERGFFLFREGKFEKFYPVAIGQAGRFQTPTGEFKLVSRVVNPNWLPPEWAGLGKDTVVPAGPDNPLGDRWMGLSSPGLGIHSTTSPASIGAAASHGCMRMYPVMAREVFEKVTIGMPVRIEYEPIKLGFEEGVFYVVVYPDVYRQADPKARLMKLLQSEGLDGVVSEQRIEELVAQAQGFPRPVLARDVKVAFEGRSLENQAFWLEGKTYLGSESLREMGAEVNLSGSDTEQETIKLDFRGLSPILDEKLISKNFKGETLFPAREILELFGYRPVWDGVARTLTVVQL